MLKILARPGLIILAFIAGYSLPKMAACAFLIPNFLQLMLYFIFLQVRLQWLKPRKTHWRLLAANIGIGLAAWGLLLPAGSKELACAAFFTGIAPTASAAPVIIRFLGGSAEFVVTAFLLTNAGVSVALAGLIPLVTGNFAPAFLMKVAGNLLFIMGLPMAAAALTGKIYPLSREWPAKMKNVSFALWIAMLFLTAANASDFIRNRPDLSPLILLKTAGISAAVCAFNFVFGFLISEKRCRREASQSLGQKNTMFTLSLALTFSGPLAAMGPTFYVLWHNLMNAVQIFLHDRKMHSRKKRFACEKKIPEYLKTEPEHAEK